MSVDVLNGQLREDMYMNWKMKACVLTGAILFLAGLHAFAQGVDRGGAKEPGARPRPERRGARAVRARNMDPEEFRKRQEEAKKRRAEWQKRADERLRKELKIKTDEEWEIIKEKIEKVRKFRNVLRMSKSSTRGYIGRARMQKGGREIPKFWADREKNFLAENPDAAPVFEAAKALGQILAEDNALDDEIEQKMKQYRDALAAFQQNLLKAQADLKQIIDVRQQALLLGQGILD